MENQLNRLLESGRIHRKNREWASQILNAVEGMGIWEARELLGLCADVLELLTVSYKTPRSSSGAVPPTTINPAMPRQAPSKTAQQYADDAFVDEIAGKLAKRLCEAAGGTSQAYAS